MKFFRNMAVILLAAVAILLNVEIPEHASAQSALDPIGCLDTPTNSAAVKGQVAVKGWFLDATGVSKVEVLVDNAVDGQAIYNDARPDVLNVYPQYKNGNAGFHYTLDTTRFNDGIHTVTIRETGTNGQVTTLPARTITIVNVKGNLDAPASGATLLGTQNLYGWFLDESGVVSVDVLVDGTVAGQASYGDARPDVHNVYPEYSNGAKSGYHFALDTTKFGDGPHTVTVRETGSNGHVTTLPARTIIIANVKGNLDAPASGATLLGTRNLYGWFLDEGGVSKVEVLVDGTVEGQAAYGDSRADVLKVYPDYHNGNAGYHYLLDTTKFSDGNHKITVRETRSNGLVTTLQEKSIAISNVKFCLDTPVPNQTIKGNFKLFGWLLDYSDVSKLEVLVDGTVAGQAVYGDPRADVQKVYPEYNNGAAGYHYIMDTTKYTDGRHSISIRETRSNGLVITFPEVSVIFENVQGVMDAPVTGTTLKGTTNVSGWFLDEGGMSKVEVLVDSTPVGQAVYGDPRADVLKVYPDFHNGNSGYHYLLDTTKFSDGNHTISVRETSANGLVTTLPEKIIAISNVKYCLDNPVPNQTIKGNFKLFGWLLDYSNVSKLEVLVDGTVAGQAVYGDSRADVQKVYPEYNNGAAGYHYVLDTTKYTDGRHSVSIRETRSNGFVTTFSEVGVTFENVTE